MTVATLENAIEQLRRDFQERIDALAKAVAELQKGGTVSPGTAAAVAIPPVVAATPVAAPAPAAAPAEEVSKEVLLVITAAVTAFLGKKVRIRSAKRLQSPYEIVNPWSQQGRVFIQASHVLPRGR